MGIREAVRPGDLSQAGLLRIWWKRYPHPDITTGIANEAVRTMVQAVTSGFRLCIRSNLRLSHDSPRQDRPQCRFCRQFRHHLPPG